MNPGKPKMLKANNRRMVLELLRTESVLSIPDISERTGLSKTTSKKIINYFLEKGLILNIGKGKSTLEGGKRPDLFQLNDESGLAVGMQIHHRQLLAVLTNLKSQILHSVVLPLENNEDQKGVLHKIQLVFDRLFNETSRSPDRLIGLGLGIPGITNFQDGIIRNSPWFPSWGTDIPFRQYLVERLDLKAPVVIDNECRFQVLSEKECGVARNRENIIAVFVGAGIVAGVMVKDEISRGVHYLAGEIGHMVINPQDSERCNCGSRGCFESMVYESRLLKKAIQAFPRYSSSLVFQHGRPELVTIEDIFHASNHGDELARKLLDDILFWFTIAFSNIIMMIDPEMIVIQGSYARAGDYFIGKLRRNMNRLVLPRIKKEVEIEYSELGPEACALGAAQFVTSAYFKSAFRTASKKAFP